MENKLKRNAKDKVFKNLLENRENLAQFYYDLTGKRIDPEQIVYDTIATSLVKGKEEDVAFQVGSKYIILLEAQSTWKEKDIMRFATYMCLLFIKFMEEHEEEMFDGQNGIVVPAVEAYVVYTGNESLPETVSLEGLFPDPSETMLNARMEIVAYGSAKGMVKEYIKFAKLETEYYRENRRSKNDVFELIDFCVKNNILKNYMLEHKREVTNLIENFFTEERRIQGLINEAVNEAVNKAAYEKQKELEKAQANEITHLAQCDIPKEKIVEVTGFAPELVEEILSTIS